AGRLVVDESANHAHPGAVRDRVGDFAHLSMIIDTMDSRTLATRPRGLYLVTPDEADSARLLARVEPLLAHAAWLQYRNKAASPVLRAEQAALLQATCARAGVPLLVNDDPRLAASVGAAGVHLGEDDG